MKIIHTSDWHIGQTLYNYSREEEHIHFFNQLKNIIIEEKPDALVVSGDVFHSATPSVVSQQLYYHYLVELSKLDDDLQMIIVAGNHDSPSRLEAPRELWNAFNVSVIGNLDFYKDADVDELSYDASKVEVPIRRNNEIIGWILAVPYINPGNYPSLKENDTYSNRVFSFYNSLKNNLKLHSQYNENQHIVATGHFTLSSANTKGHDRMVGGLESVDAADMSSLTDVDYLALGHIHHPQYIGNNRRMRYSGSPFSMNFNEDYEHSVSIVEMKNHNVDVRVLEIKPLIPLLDFPSKPVSYDDADGLEDIMNKLTDILDKELYIRLHLKSDLSLSELENAMILDRFKERKARYCGVQIYLPTKTDTDSNKTIRTIEEFKSISPFELGCSVYEKKNNAEMPEEMKVLFKEVCDEVLKNK